MVKSRNCDYKQITMVDERRLYRILLWLLLGAVFLFVELPFGHHFPLKSGLELILVGLDALQNIGEAKSTAVSDGFDHFLYLFKSVQVNTRSVSSVGSLQDNVDSE